MRIVCVADYFVEDIPQGGSERSLEAILKTAPVPVERVRCRDFRPRDCSKDDLVIFGNFSQLPFATLAQMADHLRYVVIESDYKACARRNPEIHRRVSGACDCDKSGFGARVSQFYMGAEIVFWKSTAQMRWHLERWPMLKQKSIMLSVTYTDEELSFLAELGSKPGRKYGWAVFKTDNVLKGYQESVDYCRHKGLWRVDIGKTDWKNAMRMLARRKGLVFLPVGLESCGRVAVEAKLLGCDVVMNDNVPAAKEEWFNLPAGEIASYLRGRTGVFWSAMDALIAPVKVMAC